MSIPRLVGGLSVIQQALSKDRRGHLNYDFLNPPDRQIPLAVYIFWVKSIKNMISFLLNIQNNVLRIKVSSWGLL